MSVAPAEAGAVMFGACRCPTRSGPGLRRGDDQASMLVPSAAFTSPPSTAIVSPTT